MLDELAVGEQLQRSLRHLRGITRTPQEPADIVAMAEAAAEFFRGYVTALRDLKALPTDDFGILISEIMDELELVYRKHAPEKACPLNPNE